MGLSKPKLDDLTFEKLISEAKRLIPRYAPQWTDHNFTDPGITLIELLAWLTETSLYRLNFISERHIKKYLQLLGIIPQPTKPAIVEVSFESSILDELNKGDLIFTEFGGKKFYFELAHSIKIVPLKLEKVVVDEITGIFDRTEFNTDPEFFFSPFGDNTMDGAMLYLGFELKSSNKKNNDENQSISIPVNFFVSLYEDDLIPVGEHGDEKYYKFKNAELIWEYVHSDGKWKKITPVLDETEDFKYSGRVEFEKIEDWAKTTLPFSKLKLYWLRCRLEKSYFEYPPRIRTIRLNTTKAIHGKTIKTEEIFIGTGLPGQKYKLEYKSVLKKTVRLTVNNELWEEKNDFYGSGAQDKHFVIDSKEGVILFGDGFMGAVPPDRAEIKILEYRIGGGSEGNLPANLSWIAEKKPELQIINYTPAKDGSEEESIEEARLRFLKDLKICYRAVSSEDFEYIARNTPGLRVSRAKAFVEDEIVIIVVVPYTPVEVFQKPPEPSKEFLNAICKHVDKHRLLGTKIKVVGPEYIKVDTSIKIEIETGFNEKKLREKIKKIINIYLHPVKGGKDGKGWIPGEPVYRSEIYKLIQQIEGVRCVINVELFGNKGSKRDFEGNLILPSKKAVVYSGTHNIVFVRTTEKCRG